MWLTLDLFLFFSQFFVSLQDGAGLCTLVLQELLQNLLSLQKTGLIGCCIDFDSNRNQVTKISWNVGHHYWLMMDGFWFSNTIRCWCCLVSSSYPDSFLGLGPVLCHYVVMVIAVKPIASWCGVRPLLHPLIHQSRQILQKSLALLLWGIPVLFEKVGGVVANGLLKDLLGIFRFRHMNPGMPCYYSE